MASHVEPGTRPCHFRAAPEACLTTERPFRRLSSQCRLQSESTQGHASPGRASVRRGLAAGGLVQSPLLMETDSVTSCPRPLPVSSSSTGSTQTQSETQQVIKRVSTNPLKSLCKEAEDPK